MEGGSQGEAVAADEEEGIHGSLLAVAPIIQIRVEKADGGSGVS